MYTPRIFREDRRELLHAVIRDHPLATLVTAGAQGILANLIPFTLARSDAGQDVLRAHLTKVNGQVADLRDGGEALVIFQGPAAYVSPSWYPTKAEHGRAVPTWNYVVVQARGVPRVIDAPDWLLGQIGALTEAQEAGRAEPWSVADAPAGYVAELLGFITGVEIPISRIEGKWKISQNQPEANRRGVVEGLRAGDPADAMADLVERGR